MRGTAQIKWFGDKARETRLRQFGHVKRRWLYWTKDVECGVAREKRERPQRRFIYVVKEDMHRVCMIEQDGSGEMEEDDLLWRPLPQEEEEEEEACFTLTLYFLTGIASQTMEHL